MRKVTIILVLVVVVGSLFLFGCGSSKATPDLSKGKAVVENKCSTCHAIGLVEIAAYDKQGWTETVDRMILKGASMTDSDKTLAIEYLAATYYP